MKEPICDVIRRITGDLRPQCGLYGQEAVTTMGVLGEHLQTGVFWFRNGGGRRGLEALDSFLRVYFFWFWIGVGILLAYYSHDGYGSGLGALIFGSLFLIYSLRRLYRKFTASKAQHVDIVVVIFAFAVLVFGVTGLNAFVQIHESNFAPLLTALEQYRDTTGQYPDELDVLVPEHVASLPQCPMTGGWPGEHYYYKRRAGEPWEGTYHIQCVVGAFVFPQYGMYESEDGTWVYTD